MTQEQLKNIYEALGSLRFKYHGKMHWVSKNEETGEYKILMVV